MTGKNIKIFLTACCAALSAAQPSLAADIYKKMANDIAGYSAANKVKNIAVISFARKAMTSREECEYVAEKLLACLVASGKVNIMERSQLDKVMQERRLALSGAADGPEDSGPGRIRSTDAIVTGTVFGTRNQLKIIAKIIDPRTGAVLHTIEAAADRQWDMLSERPDFAFNVPALEELAAIFNEEARLPALGDFRDAVVSADAGGCAVKWFRVAVLQSGSVEAKAKYWALRLRDPQFSGAALTKNPGGEIQDPQVKKKFYELLERFFKSSELPAMSPGELESVKTVIAEEQRMSDECGTI